MGMTDHEAVQSLLAPYALDAVDVDEVLEIEAHLDTCPECVATLAELRETVVLLAALPEATRADRPDPAWPRAPWRPPWPTDLPGRWSSPRPRST